jgi:hypothetical protein
MKEVEMKSGGRREVEQGPLHSELRTLNLGRSLVKCPLQDQIVFKNSVRTSKRTPHLAITKINWLMLFKEIIAVYI